LPPLGAIERKQGEMYVDHLCRSRKKHESIASAVVNVDNNDVARS
jgi:hypothetical protein